MQDESTILKNYHSIINALTDLAERASELSNVRREEILTAVAPLVEAELRNYEAKARNIDEEISSVLEQETDYIAKRLMSANDFEQDMERFIKGLDADGRAWREDFYLHYLRQREVVFCICEALKAFKKDFGDKLDVSGGHFLTEMLNESENSLSSLMDELKNGLEDTIPLILKAEDNGVIDSMPTIPDNQGAFILGELDMDLTAEMNCQLPIILDDDRLNAITYQFPKNSDDATSRDNCRALLENLLMSILMYRLPDTTVSIYDGDSLLAGFDGLLRNLKRQLGETAIQVINHFAKFDENSIMTQSSEFTIDKDVDFGSLKKKTAYTIVLVPENIDDREVARYKTTIENAVSQGKYGFHLVLVGQYDTISRFGDWDKRKCSCNQLDLLPDRKVRYTVEGRTIEGTVHVSSWTKGEKKQRIISVIDSLATPPKPISKAAISLRVAHYPNDEKAYNIFLDDAYSGTTFIEGEPGAGKSILLTQMLLDAIERYDNRHVQFLLMDLKGGLTFNKFDHLPQVKYILSVKGENDADVVRAFIEL
ncbi:MAG: hypothetical protein IJS08_10310, partial [Victivallales bacterium]|nr:hypothetical protein [Victivallales bacterium]